MNRFISVVLLVMCCVSLAWAQGKGVDNSSERVRDNASSSPGNNGSKTNTGAGRGMDFGRPPEVPPIPNPYRMTARRDVIINAVAELMKERKMIVDEAASRPAEGIIVSQPLTFIKGAVVSQGEISRYADVTTTRDRGWTRGRYTISVEVQPIDGISANVSVNAKIEGRTDGATGAEWLTLQSTGLAEEEFLSALITKITGGPPPGRIEE